MKQATKVVEPKRSEIIQPQTFSIGPGKGGYQYVPFLVKKEGKKEHRVFFNIQVLQPAGRQDLDINFFVVDEANFSKWVAGSPNLAYLIAPRIILGELSFTPPSSSRYYAVLNNQFSLLTFKQVNFSCYETWLQEKIPVEKAAKVETVTPETQPRFWKRLYSKMRYSSTLGFIGLLLGVSVVGFLISGLIILLFQWTFGLDSKDVMGYLAASVGPSTLILLFALYYFRTGKPIPTAVH